MDTMIWRDMSTLAKIGSRPGQHLARAHDDDTLIATSRPELLYAALRMKHEIATYIIKFGRHPSRFSTCYEFTPT